MADSICLENYYIKLLGLTVSENVLDKNFLFVDVLKKELDSISNNFSFPGNSFVFDEERDRVVLGLRNNKVSDIVLCRVSDEDNNLVGYILKYNLKLHAKSIVPKFVYIINSPRYEFVYSTDFCEMAFITFKENNVIKGKLCLDPIKNIFIYESRNTEFDDAVRLSLSTNSSFDGIGVNGISLESHTGYNSIYQQFSLSSEFYNRKNLKNKVLNNTVIESCDGESFSAHDFRGDVFINHCVLSGEVDNLLVSDMAADIVSLPFIDFVKSDLKEFNCINDFRNLVKQLNLNIDPIKDVIINCFDDVELVKILLDDDTFKRVPKKE